MTALPLGRCARRSLHSERPWFPLKALATLTTPTDATSIRSARVRNTFINKSWTRKKLRLPTLHLEAPHEQRFGCRDSDDLATRVARQGDAQVSGIYRDQE